MTRLENSMKRKGVYLELWRGKNLRRTLLAIATITIHSAQGSSWATIYTTYYLAMANIADPFGYSILVTAMGIIGVLCSMFVVRHMGRRTILLIGAFSCGLTQLAPAIAWSVAPNTMATGKALVAFICLFIFSYTATAPYAWLAVSVHPRTLNTLLIDVGRRDAVAGATVYYIRNCNSYKLCFQFSWQFYRSVFHQSYC